MNHSSPPDQAAGVADFTPAVQAVVTARISDRLAHDCNNAMAGVLALGEEFQFHLEDGEAFPEGLKLLKGNVMRTKQIVQRIVELPVKSGPKKHHNLNDLVVEAVDLTRKFLPRDQSVEVALAPEPLPVHVDAAAFRWLFIELAWRAANASLSEGKLSVGTTRQTGSTPSLILSLTVDRQMPFPNKPGGPVLIYLAPFVETHAAVFSLENNGKTFQLRLPESDFREPEVD